MPEQGLLSGHQPILIGQSKPVTQSHFVGDTHEVLLVRLPIELNPQGLQCLVPGAMMDTLGIGQNTVEIEQKRIETGAG